MAFPVPGEINCGNVQNIEMQQTVVELLNDPDKRTEGGVNVGCPGLGCETCANGLYSAVTDITCMECPPGTNGAGSPGAASLAIGCPTCTQGKVQSKAGQTSCTACTPGSDSEDKIACACSVGYSRQCSGDATEAVVTGLPEGDGTYVLQEVVQGKPIFKATIYAGTVSNQYFLAYNKTFLEWQVYKRQPTMCNDPKGCGILAKGEGYCTADKGCPETIPGPSTTDGVTTLTQVKDEVSCLPLDNPSNPSKCNSTVFTKTYV
jgi:hypothetical protein